MKVKLQYESSPAHLIPYFYFFFPNGQKNCTSKLSVQLIQNLSILAQNLSNHQSVFYLLSNNHVNAFITHAYDWRDDELLAYYVSFIKTLSLRLDEEMIQFFYNKEEDTFVLFDAVSKFMGHEEAMIRTAARTALLNTFRVNDAPARKFLVRRCPEVLRTLVRYTRNLSISSKERMKERKLERREGSGMEILLHS